MILKSTRALALLFTGFAASNAPNLAAAQDIGPAIASYEAGVICPSTGDGVSQMPFVARTLVVPSVIGMAFGVRAQTTEATGPVQAQIVLTHPPFAGSGQTQQVFNATFGVGPGGGFLYRFDAPEELAVGTWQIQATSGGAVLFTIPFDVVMPAANDGLLRACGL